MAKIKRIDGSVISGKVGGLVYKVGANGPYVQPYRRKRATKVNSQQYIQQFTTLATHWKTLTAAEQYSWEAARYHFPKYVKGRDPIILTRKQLYMSHSAILMQWCGYDINTLPKLAPSPAPILGVDSVFFIARNFSTKQLKADLRFANGLPQVPPDHILVISASMPVQFVSGEGPSMPCTHLTTLNAGSLVGGYNMWFDYESKFVPIKYNDLLWFEYMTVHVLTGQITRRIRQKIYITL